MDKEVKISSGDDSSKKPEVIDQGTNEQGESSEPDSDTSLPNIEEPKPVEETEPPKKKHIIFIVIVFVLIALGAAFFVWKDQIMGLFVKQSVVSQTAPDTTKVTDPALLKFITPTTGEVWHKTPKEMENQGYLNNDYRDTFVSQYTTSAETDTQYARMKSTYYEVGTRGDKTIIMARQPAEVSSDYAAFFEKQTDGTVSVIAKPSSTATYDKNYVQYVKDTIKTSKVAVFDETIHYDSLSIPDTITLKNGEIIQSLKSASFLFGSRAEGTSETVVMDLGLSKMYRIEKSYADTNLTNIGYTVRTNFGPEIQVDYIPNTRLLEKYTFDNGKAATYKDYQGSTVYDEINAIARGCGGTSAAVTRADKLQESDLVQVGKTDAGRVVYSLKDKNSALMTKAYSEYKESYENSVSLDDYIANHGLLIMKNTSGEFLVYVRGQYGMSGGCAKPVVYLYPTVAQNVSVKVGANVTVSDPQYTASGWQNVFARPNGQLTYQGKAYDSLFWEGQGYGDYPGIASGTVVKRANAASTIKKQLAEQGLNAKESSDFMAFWESKIPNKPYIRLTWLTMSQMNTLAPLYVSPKPDTVLRVFLDMDGYDTPITLPTQKLSSVSRQGFTVVEWGGLTSEIRH